jgi:hypothetical protein
MTIGCAAARQSKPAAEAPRVAAFLPHDLQPVPPPSLPAADGLAALHKALARPGDPHDVILEIARINDATSVPFLIEALAREGQVPSAGPYAAIDTRLHCLEALQVITNQDAGRNAEDWRSWYEANRLKSQEQWIREGFAQKGFPVSDPPDDSFISALIRASDPKYRPGHIRTNALRTLAAIRAESVLRLAGSLAASPDASDRRAALAALERVPGDARLPVLRTLAGDPDIDVAENALRALNSALRLALPALVPASVWDVGLAKAGVHVLHVLNEDTVVLGIGYGIVDETRVVGFDLHAHQVTWMYATDDGVRSNAVRVGDYLYFVSDGRVIHCISVDGKPRWAKPLTSNPDLGTTGPAITAVGDRLFVPDGRSVYVVSLAGEVQAHAVGDHVSRDLVQGRRKVFGAIHNGPLLVFEEAAAPKRVATGLKTAALSAAGDVVCIVSFGPTYQVQCLDQETLRELWRADLPNEVGAYHTLEQDADSVYVLAQGRALAFDLATGKRRWATNEFRSFAFFKIVGRAAVTDSFESDLEWRDPSSGEVIAFLKRRDGVFAANAVVLDETVLVETRETGNERDGLRLLRLPESVKHRLTPR